MGRSLECPPFREGGRKVGAPAPASSSLDIICITPGASVGIIKISTDETVECPPFRERHAKGWGTPQVAPQRLKPPKSEASDIGTSGTRALPGLIGKFCVHAGYIYISLMHHLKRKTMGHPAEIVLIDFWQ